MEIAYTPRGHAAYECVLNTASGCSLKICGTIVDGTAQDSGDAALISNRSLVMMLSAFANNEALSRRLRAQDKRKSHRQAAEGFRKNVLRLADLIDRLDDDDLKARQEWCSCCFSWCLHRPVRGMARPLPTSLCMGCGAPTTNCPAPRCNHFASRGFGRGSAPKYCAEHRHDIPSFEKLDAHLEHLDDYADWLKFENVNLSRLTKMTTVAVLSAAVITPAAFVAAPAIGGAAGSLTGLTGAAATSHGLAMFGGGSLAAGGLGMAGGTMVVTAIGASLGGAVGASVTSAYVRADPSFEIIRLAEGEGTPVVLASGFLTEKEKGWGGWEEIVRRRYPSNPVYRVRWGAREFKALMFGLGGHGGKHGATIAVHKYAKKAGMAAAGKLGPLAPMLAGAGLLKNPWTVAKTRAGMTGAIVADLLARADEDRFVLMGHSLGGRVMVTAAQHLGTLPGALKRIEALHLLGTAVSSGGDWRTLSHAVDTKVYNYWSSEDPVLKLLYSAGEFGKRAVGQKGFGSKFPNIVDKNVSRSVTDHSAYLGNVKLA
jgi:pimeloyl-ACP methyl ester carboxylesterase